MSHHVMHSSKRLHDFTVWLIHTSTNFANWIGYERKEIRERNGVRDKMVFMDEMKFENENTNNRMWKITVIIIPIWERISLLLKSYMKTIISSFLTYFSLATTSVVNSGQTRHDRGWKQPSASERDRVAR